MRPPGSATPKRTGADLTAAACRALDPVEADRIFLPERGESVAEAKAICRRCPVRAECLDIAIANHESCGIWGGTSYRERQRIARARRRGLAEPVVRWPDDDEVERARTRRLNAPRVVVIDDSKPVRAEVTAAYLRALDRRR